MISLDGEALPIAAVVHTGTDGATLATTGRARILRSHAAIGAIATQQPVYGRSTGVGANKDVTACADPSTDLDLLRSHAAGWGHPLSAPVIRAALAVRLNQLAVGRSGISTSTADALAALLQAPDGELPCVRTHGDLGTADLTALATIGLTLAGERPCLDGQRRPRHTFPGGDALPLMSSSAVTIARCAHVLHDLRAQLSAAEVVIALGMLAHRGNPASLDPDGLAQTGATVDQVAVARRVRRHIGEVRVEPRSVQDFFGFRTVPQLHGEAWRRAEDCAAVASRLTGVGAENPAVLESPAPRTLHHGGFHQATLAQGVDATAVAVTSSAALSLSRISHLLSEPEAPARRFFATGPSGSSGLLIAEYRAASALARMRSLAGTPVGVQTVQLSAGVEDHASLAPLAVDRLNEVASCYRQVLAAEWLVAHTCALTHGIAPSGLWSIGTEVFGSAPAARDRDLQAELDDAVGRLRHLSEQDGPMPH